MTIDERIEALLISQDRTQQDLENLTELVRQMVLTVSDHRPLDHEPRLRELERWRQRVKNS